VGSPKAGTARYKFLNKVIACVYDLKENKITKDLQILWNNDMQNKKWEFLLEEGDLLLRMQLVNMLLKIFIRSDNDDSFAKIKYFKIQINYYIE
jgi:hypothetical protein